MRALIFIFDKKTDGRPQSDTVFGSRLKMNKVFLVTLLAKIGQSESDSGKQETNRCGQVALTGAAATELGLDILSCKFKPLVTG